MKGILQSKDINENNMNKSDNLTSVKVHGMICLDYTYGI